MVAPNLTIPLLHAIDYKLAAAAMSAMGAAQADREAALAECMGAVGAREAHREANQDHRTLLRKRKRESAELETGS